MLERGRLWGVRVDKEGLRREIEKLGVAEMGAAERVLRDVRRDPESLHRLLRLSVEASLAWVEAMHRQTGCESVGISDPVTTTDILGKKQFDEFSRPYLKQLFDGIVRITGEKPFVHICGHTKGIWGDLVQIGVDELSLDDCENLAEAKEAMGDKVFLCGNVAPVEVLRHGSIDEVISAARSCLEECAGSPQGFMLMSGCQVPMGTPMENMEAFVYAARRYGRGARLGLAPKGLALELERDERHGQTPGATFAHLHLGPAGRFGR